jgi:hypothetical protein
MALPNECIELRRWNWLQASRKGIDYFTQQRKPRVVFRFAAEDYHIATRYIKDFLRYVSKLVRNVPILNSLEVAIS